MKYSTGLLLLLAAGVCGCSHDAAQRAAYESLRTMDRNKCNEATQTEPCPPREGYDDYQRHRKELEESQH